MLIYQNFLLESISTSSFIRVVTISATLATRKLLAMMSLRPILSDKIATKI